MLLQKYRLRFQIHDKKKAAATLIGAKLAAQKEWPER